MTAPSKASLERAAKIMGRGLEPLASGLAIEMVLTDLDNRRLVAIALALDEQHKRTAEECAVDAGKLPRDPVTTSRRIRRIRDGDPS